MSSQTLEVSLSGIGTVRRLEMDAWSMVNDTGKQQTKSAPSHA